MPLNDPISAMMMSHDMLSSVLPFYCAWLDDGTGEPDAASVSLGPVIFAVNVWNKPRKVWIN